MSELGRVLTAMVTPFDEKGDVDYDQARKLALALVESGSDGLVVVGTTGESPTLLREEEVRLFAEIKAAVGDRGSVIAGTGSNSTAEAIATTKEAERVGVDACLIVVPYYNKPTQDGIYQHFKTVADSTSLPCILYNVPGRTAADMATDTVLRLREIDNIVGLKEANGKLEHVARILDGTHGEFLIWSGNDPDTLPIVAIGGYGVISVASHLVGKQIQDMIRSALAGDRDRAAQIHRILLPLFDALFVVSNPIPIKYALNHLGFRVGDPRPPLYPADREAAAFIEATLKQYRIDLPIG